MESQIRMGRPDLQGQCLALADCSSELRLLLGIAIAATHLAYVRSGRA